MSDITKLPKWAQEYIERISRQRDVAVEELNNYIDSQTPSAFFTDELLCIGEQGRSPSFKRRYFQTNSVTVVHEGVTLRVLLREKQIDLSWNGATSSIGEVALIPASYQQVRLISKENMR